MKISRGDAEEAGRFIVVGVINTLVGSGIMFLLYNLAHADYWVSSAANYIVGSICSFFLNKFFTFRKKKYSASETVRFVVNILICYLVAYGGARPLARLVLSSVSVTIQENVAMLVGMGCFTVLNFIGQKLFVFRSNNGQEDS